MSRQFVHTSIAAPNTSNAWKQTEPAYVLAVDIGGTNLRLDLANTDGAIKARRVFSTVGVREAGTIVDKILDGLQLLLHEVSAPPGALKAVAAGAPGITDTDNGLVIATSYLLGWRDVPLRRMLENALSVPAAVDNDVNLAALGESWRGAAAGVASFAFLALGTGVGAGLFLNGQLYRGHNWTAGEVGYLLVPGLPPIGAERNQPGVLESRIGGAGLRQQWQSFAQRTSLPADLTATQIFDYAHEGDSVARELLEQTAALLARAIFNINLMLDLPLFVLGGSVGMHEALYHAVLPRLAALNLRNPPRVLRSLCGPNAQITGALRLALDTALAQTPTP
jgi:glucokinase